MGGIDTDIGRAAPYLKKACAAGFSLSHAVRQSGKLVYNKHPYYIRAHE
jgi:hypothetical protein